MSVYVLLGTLTDEGRKAVKSRPERIEEVNDEVVAFGGRILAQYALLGLYDFLTVVQAPDNETIARISIEFGSRGTIQLMSLPAFHIDSFVTQVLGAPADES